MRNYHCCTAVKIKEWHKWVTSNLALYNTHNILCIAPEIEKNVSK